MKVLSLLQPWAQLLVLGYKGPETRSWHPTNPKILEQIKREGIIIHASQRKIRLQADMHDLFDHLGNVRGFMENYKSLPYGAIIGKVYLLDTFSTEEALNRMSYIEHFTSHSKEQEKAFGDYSAGRYGWLLSDPVVFDKPIPAKGALSLWDYYPIEHIENLTEPQFTNLISK